MQAAVDGRKWQTHWVTDPKIAGPEYDASHLLRQIAEATWSCGDPGLQYETTINRWHTCPAHGRINASNPCSEYMFLDDTACNLAEPQSQKVPGRAGALRHRAIPQGCRDFPDGPGNPGRPCQLSHGPHCGQ